MQDIDLNFIHFRYDGLYCIQLQIIIRIDKTNILTGRQSDSFVTRNKCTAILIQKPYYYPVVTLREAFDQLSRSVRRVIIHDYDLYIPVGLIDHTIKTLFKIGLGIADRNYNRNF